MTTLSMQWPRRWSRQQRSSATILVASGALLVLLWLMAIPLAWAPEPIGDNARAFAEGTRVTVQLTLLAGLSGIVIGVLAALGKLAAFAPLRWLASFYIWVVRGTPLLVQVLFVFFALPVLVPALQLSDFTSACVALAFNVGAYNAEAIRAGLLAVPRGQGEAARSLGLSRWHTFIDVSFPQAFKVALAPLVNNSVALLKDSSLAYAIGVVELTNVGNRIQASTFQPVPTLVTVALLYLGLTTVMTQISGAIERHFDVEGRQP
ncbi:amino acid ABC transporter permease [Aquabacterium sp. A7-Y]|uniref:amino acid ABC transporter permease n=1 Tax=Aquabacterium sp. A7-Y TaxID=1349605 RepID=UPI00223CFD9F|nr:amino acid ABC transporter permease [Aquabacterium sp. A7-Y]MCW7539755.1 amino acid ABC transporter permease [Aquabacterium sp. A7-Y]